MSAFRLTREHVLRAFAPLAETRDAAARQRFFTDWLSPRLAWTVAGTGHSLAGTRRSLRAHSAATFDRLGRRLRGPIAFRVRRVVVDAGPDPAGGWWACVETEGRAVRVDGRRYDNEYVWLTRWDGEGRMDEIRSYFDTALAEEVLRGPEA